MTPVKMSVQAGEQVHGFTVKRVVPLPGADSVFVELAHDRTGARYIHLENQDPENTFAVAFKTVPADSTGVAHILEHTALCGSEKYPVRDPFFSMLKRSMNTFMNAFTASDWTMYPFSTQNRKDFKNLLGVYLDAAFFPILSELSFKQEGIRVEFGPSGEAEFKGVVYNEMKGAMSSPDQIMGRTLMKALYPDTTYGFNSGGEPADIPGLTHEDLKAFHQRYYHPSNAYFYTYGSFPLKEHCAMLEELVLGRFSAIDPKTDVPSQPRWDRPRDWEEPYPVAAGEDTEKKSQAALGWLLDGIEDSFSVMAMTLLSKILLQNAASPLRKALMDSGLGSTLSDHSGFDGENRDTMFTCGLKDIKKQDAREVFDLVEKSLENLVDTGIENELVETAIHQYEFERREVTSQPYAYGLRLYLSFCSAWFHHADPMAYLSFDKDMESIRNKVAGGMFFENLIQRELLDNTHKVRFTLYPDQELAQKNAAKEKEALLKQESLFNEKDREKILQDTRDLEILQDTAEDLSCLPTLEISDIPVSIPEPAPADASRMETRVTPYAQPTNGIFYLSAAARLSNVPPGLAPLVPFFCYALPKAGTKAMDYTGQARRIAANTGGLGLACSANTRFDEAGTGLDLITLDTKCLARNQEETFAIVRELIGQYSFQDLDRLETLLLEYATGFESRLVASGHAFAIVLAARGFSRARSLAEIWHGVSQLKHLKSLAKDVNRKKIEDLAGQLSALGRCVFARENVELAVAGDRDMLDRGMGGARSLLEDLGPGPSENGPRQGDEPWRFSLPGREAWTTSTSVSFVAHTFPTVRFGHPDAPVLSVCARLLKSLFLHREIREKGGAYGGFALSNAEDGLFVLASYRDPHIARTIDVFSGALEFLKDGSITDEDVKEAILQVASDIDKPDSPGIKARKAFSRRLMGLSDQARQDYKDRLLAVSKEQVIEAAHAHFNPGTPLSPVAAVTSQTLADEENREMTEHPLERIAI